MSRPEKFDRGFAFAGDKPSFWPMLKSLYSLILLGFCSLLITTPAIGQNCKYEKDEIDKFAKTRTLITKHTVLWNPGNGNNLSVKARSISGKKSLLMRYSFNENFTIPEGADITVLFEDGSTTILNAFAAVPAKKKEKELIFIANFICQLTEENLAALNAKSITDIRIAAEERNFDRPIKKEHGKRIGDIIDCLNTN